MNTDLKDRKQSTGINGQFSQWKKIINSVDIIPCISCETYQEKEYLKGIRQRHKRHQKKNPWNV